MFCRRCGTILPDVARFCENCGASVMPTEGARIEDSGVILRETPAVEVKPASSSQNTFWGLGILAAVASVVYLFLQKWFCASEAMTSSLMSSGETGSISIFDLYKGFQAMIAYIGPYGRSEEITIANAIITALAAVNLLIIVLAGISAIMLLCKKNGGAKGFAVTALVFYVLLTVATFLIVYYGNQEIGTEVLAVDPMVYIGFVPLIATVIFAHKSGKVNK